jgi:Cu(I)-responsive transcriptional regulator
MNIGQAARASGVSAKMIRYYESIGLLPAAIRSNAGYRVYGEGDLHALRFVRRARNIGFSLEETEELLKLWRDRTRASSEVKELALRHLQDLEAKIAELQGMAGSLRHLARSCHGDDRPDCPILEDLAGQGESAGAGGRKPRTIEQARPRDRARSEQRPG